VRVHIDGEGRSTRRECAVIRTPHGLNNCTVLAHPAVRVFNRFPQLPKSALPEGRAGVAALIEEIEEKVSRGPGSSHNRVISVGQDAVKRSKIRLRFYSIRRNGPEATEGVRSTGKSPAE